MPDFGPHPVIPRILRLGLAALLAFSGAVSCRSIDALSAYPQIRKSLQAPAQSPPGRLEIQDDIAIIHVYGTPSEMGTQYGTLLRTPLEAMNRFLEGVVPDAMKARLYKYADEHEQHLPPEIRQELAAIAAAADIPYRHLVAMNMVPKLACSTLAVWDPKGPDHRLIMGRNSDYFSLGLADRGMIVVVHHPHGGLATVSISFLGMVGAYTGINEKGVAFGNMLVTNEAGPPHQDHGLPIQLAMRLAAEQSSSAQQMADVLKSQTHVIPMNVMVADSREALVIELGLSQSHIRRGDGVLVSTNHFRTPSLRDRDVKCPRFQSLSAIGEKHRAGITVDQMKLALHEARMHNLNLQAVVFEPQAMRIHVSINKVPASAGPYTQLDLRALLATPALPAQ